MKSKFLKTSTLIALSLALFGCSESPMDALKNSTVDPKYNAQYWIDASKNNNQLYNQAIKYCELNPEKPNCASVGDAMSYFFNSGDVQH